LKRNQNPGGHKEGRASFPIQSQYKDSKIYSSNPTLEEKGMKNRREGERRTGGRAAAVWAPAKKRERVSRYLCPLIPKLRTKLPLDLTRH